MNKSKKLLYSLLIAMGVLSTATGVLAANQNVYYAGGPTGYVYNRATSYACPKAYVNSDWSLKVTSISFSSSTHGYGVSFVPLTAGGVKEGQARWRSGTGTTYTGWNGEGRKINYHLGARTDTDLVGSVSVQGVWNSDYVTF